MATAASTTTSRPRCSPGRARGFTLLETLVAVGVSGFILAAVLGTSVMLARGSARLQAYADMDTQTRRALETLAGDLRCASNITLNSTTDLTVTVPQSDGTSATYTYAWSSSSGDFYRVPGSSSAATSGRVRLVTGGTSLAFTRLDTLGNTTTTNEATKRISVSLSVQRTSGNATVARSQSATTFVLRNKPVS